MRSQRENEHPEDEVIERSRRPQAGPVSERRNHVEAELIILGLRRVVELCDDLADSGCGCAVCQQARDWRAVLEVAKSGFDCLTLYFGEQEAARRAQFFGPARQEKPALPEVAAGPPPAPVKFREWL